MRAVCCCLLLFAASLACAEPRARFVESGTFLVATVDVERLVDPATSKQILQLIDRVEPLVDALPPKEQREVGLEYVVMELRRAKIQSLFVAAAIDDIRRDYMPLIVCELQDGADPAEARRVVQQLKPPAVEVVGDQVWIGTPKSLKRYRQLASEDRPDLLQPLVTLGSDSPALAIVVSAGQDARRVMRELWPELPTPFETLDGDLVADGIERVKLTLAIDAATRVRLAVVGQDESVSQQLGQLAELGGEWLVAKAEQEELGLGPLYTQAMSVLKPRIDGNQLVFEAATDSPEVERLLTVAIGPAVQRVRENARTNSKLNGMKQLGLAMQNFHGVRGQFPASAAIVDQAGEPLLSWRVAILPFVEEGELYRQFRFDEPWDSQHNLRVAKALPAAFANPSHPDLNEKGLTTYQMPIFPGSNLALLREDAEPYETRKDDRPIRLAPGDQFRQLTDGTSMTIQLVEVAPEHAVFWTKPDDWRVDLEDPMAKLRTDKRDGFVTAWHDGHAKLLKFTMPAEILRKVLTKNGGEVVEYDGTW